jgi:hypothetical protein
VADTRCDLYFGADHSGLSAASVIAICFIARSPRQTNHAANGKKIAAISASD